MSGTPRCPLKEDPREKKNLALDPAYNTDLWELIDMGDNFVKNMRQVTVLFTNKVPVEECGLSGALHPGFCEMPASRFLSNAKHCADGR